jgi:hypothetical protein
MSGRKLQLVASAGPSNVATPSVVHDNAEIPGEAALSCNVES